MSAASNFLDLFFPQIGQRRYAQAVDQQRQQIAQALIPFTSRTELQPYQLSPDETFGPEDALQQLQAAGNTGLSSRVQLPGLFSQSQAQGIAGLLANPNTAKFGQALLSQMVTPPDTTTLYKNAIAAGLVPGTKEFQDFIHQAVLKPSTQISLGEQRLSVADAKSLVDEKGMHPPAGILWNQLDTSKYKIQSPEQQKNENTLAGVSQILGRMVDLYFDPKNPLYFEGGIQERIKKGISNMSDLASQGHTNASSYNALVEGSLAPIVKSLGETGNLAKEDITRARKLLSDLALPDKKGVAVQKFKQLYEILQKGLGRNARLDLPGALTGGAPPPPPGYDKVVK